MSWMDRFWTTFRRRRYERIPQDTVAGSTTSKARESLTLYELDLIRHYTREKGHLCCPDCGGALLEGPEGGMSMNTACKKCHGEFNVTIFDSKLVCVDRISDKGPRSIGDRGWCYGLPNDAEPTAADSSTPS
jgi:hypothetical protein